MTSKKTTIEEKYQSLTEQEHVLKRPGMYVGSTVTAEKEMWLLKDGKFEKFTINYNPGFFKLFDEILSNSCDESKRNHDLTQIKVEVNTKKGMISVYDNGGIPVELHKKENMYIPEMIFSKMRAGSNFDDTESRDVIGTNGLGSTLTNIFSTKFKVETADGKKKFVQTFTQNMSKRSEPEITETSDHFTKITYIPELSRFGMDCISEDDVKVMEKRVYDAAATNTNVTFWFNGKKIKIKSFKDYCELYIPTICAPLK